MVLIGVHTSDGCIGRCDAKCYDATHPDCDCICNGMNHGSGLDRAREQTRDLAQDQLEAIQARGGFIPDDVRQLQLF